MESSKEEAPNIAPPSATHEIQVSKKIEHVVKKAIACIGNQNRYQAILVVYFSFIFTFTSFILLGSSYFFMNPLFECNGKPVSEEQACQHLDQCHITNSYTITAHAQLYCGQAGKDRQIIQSMLGIGSVLGVVLINAISDYRGRKFSFIMALTFGFLSVSLLIIGAYTKLPFLMITSQILAGFTANSLMNIIYVFIDKLMSKKWMNYTILITNGFWCAAEMMLIIFTISLNWQHLSILFMLLPCFVLLGLSCVLLVEDPVFLFTKRQFEKCSNSIKTIAKINKTEHKLQQALNILAVLQKQDLNALETQISNRNVIANKFKYILILKNPIIFVPIICLGLFNLGGNINYYILNFAINSTGNSYGLNVLLFGIFELLGVFPMLYLNSRVPRKFGLLVIILVQTAIAAPFFFFDLSPTFQTVSIVAIRFLTMIQYALVIYLYVEIFPQQIQSTSIGCIEFIAQMGKFIAPFLVGVAEHLEISPVTVIAISLVVLGFITMMPIKQTLPRKQKEEKKDHTAETSENTAELLIN